MNEINFFKALNDYLLHNKGDTPAIIAAQNCPLEIALEHYRYQYDEKILDVLRDTFPITKKIFQNLNDIPLNWKNLVNEYLQKNYPSPRSLNSCASDFLQYLKKHSFDLAQPCAFELLTFEYYLDEIKNLIPTPPRETHFVDFQHLQGSEKFALHEFIQLELNFNICEIYLKEKWVVQQYKNFVLIWPTDEGIFFKELLSWQIELLKNLENGLVQALEKVDESQIKDHNEIKDFFQWLGKAKLIKKF